MYNQPRKVSCTFQLPSKIGLSPLDRAHTRITPQQASLGNGYTPSQSERRMVSKSSVQLSCSLIYRALRRELPRNPDRILDLPLLTVNMDNQKVT